MKKIIFFSSLLCHFFAFCQKKVFFGKISDNLGTLPHVHIVNKNNNSATSSNENGEFRIFAKPKDTLIFTSVGYKTKILILQTSDFGINEKQIKLKKEIIELDEITVKKHNLTGNLSSDTKLVKTEKEINAKTLQLPNANKRKLTVAERRLFTATGGGLLGIDYIINLLSGRIKKLKTLKKIEDNEKQIKNLKNTFTNYIINDLKIDSTNLYRFIYFCQEDKNYKIAKKKGKFAIIDFLRQKSVKFKELNKKD